MGPNEVKKLPSTESLIASKGESYHDKGIGNLGIQAQSIYSKAGSEITSLAPHNLKYNTSLLGVDLNYKQSMQMAAEPDQTHDSNNHGLDIES